MEREIMHFFRVYLMNSSIESTIQSCDQLSYTFKTFDEAFCFIRDIQSDGIYVGYLIEEEDI